MKNPLRYPGAKSKLVSYVKRLIEVENLVGCTLYEPFAGSATMSLSLLEQNVVSNVVINEKDPLIYNFWLSVFEYTEDLIRLIQETDITIDNWKEYAKYRDNDYLLDKTVVQIGYAGLFLNRTNFSGILKANPLGGIKQSSKYKIDCRFNKRKIIESIRQISKYKEKVRVCYGDAIDFMKKELKYKRNNKTFVYIDPPYYLEGPGLYRCFYTEQEHKQLAKYIKTKSFPWLLSYDDTEEIRKLYNRRNCVNLFLDYSVKTSKKGKEVLISNLEIPPLVQQSEAVG